MTPLYAGIDVGGTSIKTLVVDEDGTPVYHHVQPTSANVVEQICAIAHHVVANHPAVAGVGVICPGIVNEPTGVVEYASNLDLRGDTIAHAVTTATGRPTILGHDGRSAGLAETTFATGKAVSSTIVISIGTGISAALCLGNQVWAGETFSAGESGHVPVVLDGEQCTCGQRGCLDVYASGAGISRRFRALTGEDVTAREIIARVGEGGPADRIWGEAIRYLAVALTHLVLTFDPGRIVIAGGLSGAGAVLVDPLTERMKAMLAWREVPDITTSTLGDAAGRWGATILACRAARSRACDDWQPRPF